MSTTVSIKRAYEPAQEQDGCRAFVDRLWPRGLAKSEFHFDLWCKDLAPSPELRKWFGHKVERWDKFQHDYERELQEPAQQERMRELLDQAKGRPLTLVYGAKDVEHNQAIVLADALRRMSDGKRGH